MGFWGISLNLGPKISYTILGIIENREVLTGHRFQFLLFTLHFKHLVENQPEIPESRAVSEPSRYTAYSMCVICAQGLQRRVKIRGASSCCAFTALTSEYTPARNSSALPSNTSCRSNNVSAQSARKQAACRFGKEEETHISFDPHHTLSCAREFTKISGQEEQT
jgi:hypothetical protein